MTLIGGLDLGQLQDHTALAVLERTESRDPGQRARYAVRHLERWPLRTSYTAIIDDVVSHYAELSLSWCPLVVDRTGVGVAVYEMLLEAAPAAVLQAVTITGGRDSACAPDGSFTVPKRELAGTLQAILGTGRLKIAPGLPLAGELAREMAIFKVKINIATGNESFEAWRERDHDDIVLAVALAAWYGELIRGGGDDGGGPIHIRY